MNTKYRIIAFGVYALGILGFISMTIMSQNKVFHKGTAYKFKCEPVDPSDPFRGKFIRLRFEQIRIEHQPTFIPQYPYYGLIQKDSDGYAFINSLIENPSTEDVYLELELNRQEPTYTIFSLPIDRLYMNEDKAQKAEDLYRNALRDSTQNVYANIFINKGRFLLEDVYLDDKPLKELID